MEANLRNWQRWFRAATLELGWSWAALMVETASTVHVEDFASPTMLEALLEYLRRAPADEQRILRRCILIDGRHHTHLPLAEWRAAVYEALWIHLATRMLESTLQGDFKKVGPFCESLLSIPIATLTQRRIWRRSVVLIALEIARVEREAGYPAALAEDLDAPAPVELPATGPVPFEAVHVMSAIAAATEESGLHSLELLFVLRVVFRKTSWPTWRTLGWLGLVEPRVRPLALSMAAHPHRWPIGAIAHLNALLRRHEFKTERGDLTWEA